MDTHEKCPICKGKGIIKSPSLKAKKLRDKKDIAKILRKEGYSMREIMRLMNYKSTRSISLLLNQE